MIRYMAAHLRRASSSSIFQIPRFRLSLASDGNGEEAEAPAAQETAAEVQEEEATEAVVTEDVVVQEEGTPNAYRRISQKYRLITGSSIDNMSILPGCYLFEPQSVERQAIQNRLREMQEEYPLDLISLLRRQGRTTSFSNIQSSWLRVSNHREPNMPELTYVVEKMITEGCYSRILNGPQQAEFIINASHTFEPLKTVLKGNNGVFLQKYLNDRTIVSLLEKVAAGKLNSSRLELLRYYSRITTPDRSGRKKLFVNSSLVEKLLELKTLQGMSKLELMYYLMILTPQECKSTFKLDSFLNEISQISHSADIETRQECRSEIRAIVQGGLSNKPLQYLLAEVFFTSPNFLAATKNTTLMIVLLARLNNYLKNRSEVSLDDILETIEAPSKQWMTDNFEVRLPSILESLNKRLYESYVQLYNEYLRSKQMKVIRNDTTASNYFDQQFKIHEGFKLYVDGLLVPQPIKHQISQDIIEQRYVNTTNQAEDDRPRHTKNKLKLKNSLSKPLAIEDKIQVNTAGTKPAKIDALSLLINSTLSEDFTSYQQAILKVFKEKDPDTYSELIELKASLPLTRQYKQIMASAKTQEEKRRKGVLLFLQSAEHILSSISSPVTLRDVLTSAAGKNRAYVGKNRRPQLNEGRRDEVEGDDLAIIAESTEAIADDTIDIVEETLVIEEGTENAEIVQQAQGTVQQSKVSQMEPTQQIKVKKEDTPLRLNRFQKKSFTTIKTITHIEQTDKTKDEQKQDGLASYLKVLRQIDEITEAEIHKKQLVQQQPQHKYRTQNSEVLIETINKSKSLEEACKHFYAYIAHNKTSASIDDLLETKKLKYFKNGEHLLIGMFMYGTVAPRSAVVKPSPKLECIFETGLGPMEKDYNKYLDVQTCAIDFGLSVSAYKVILKKLTRTYSRSMLKRTIAHIVQYCTQIHEDTVKLIYDLCNRERVAFTALQFAQLLVQNNISVSQQSFIFIVRVLKNYKDINDEVPELYRKYVNNFKWQIEPELIESYVGNLVKANRSEKLTDVIKMVKELVMPKKYKFQDKLNATENTRLETEAKENARLVNRQISFKLASVFSRYGEAEHAETLFNDYLEGVKTLNDADIALGYLCYSNNPQKFREILDLQAKRPAITQEQFNNVLKALELRPRNLQNELQKVLDLFIYDQKLLMNEATVIQVSRIIRKSDNLLLFSRMLEHLLRTQPPLSNETKRLFFRILNQTKEDAGKTYIKGLLDILFDKERKQERQKYKQTWESEQTKKARLDEIKKQALSKLEEKKKMEQAEEQELLVKHGLVKEEKPKQDGNNAIVKQQNVSQKKNKKQEQQDKAKIENNKQKEGQAPINKTVLVEAEKKPQSKGKGKQNQTAEQNQQKKNSGEKSQKGAAKQDDKTKQKAASDGKTARPEREDFIDLSVKRSINSKAIRRGGRNKFFDMTMTEEQLQQQEQLNKKQGRRRH